MTITDALAAQDVDALLPALDAALHEVTSGSTCGWSMHTVIDALEAVYVLAAARGGSPGHVSKDAVAFLVGVKPQVATTDRVEAARAALNTMRMSPRLDEVMHSADPQSWVEIYAEAMQSLG